MIKNIFLIVISVVTLCYPIHAAEFPWVIDVKAEYMQATQSHTGDAFNSFQDDSVVWQDMERHVSYTEIYLGLTWGWTNKYPWSLLRHTVYASTTTYFWQQPVWKKPLDAGSQINGFPFRDIYTVGAKLHLGPVYIKYEHYCSHPVYTQGPYSSDEWYGNKWIHAGDEIGIGIEFQFTPDGLRSKL